MKIYICGNITGQRAELTMKFGMAQKKLEAQGHEGINPLAVITHFKIPHQLKIRQRLTALLQCQRIYVLPCWEDCSDAREEMRIAKLVGIERIFDAYDSKIVTEAKRSIRQRHLNELNPNQ